LPERLWRGADFEQQPWSSRLESAVNKTKPFLVTENPNYKFAALPKMPETQMVMLFPRRSWVRLAEYIPAYEAVNLAGRFGADPGDYEWEWLSDPEGIRWWRRDATGRESLFGMAVAVHRNDLVELYGLVEVDETSSFWADVIPEEAANAMPLQAKLAARQQNRPEKDSLYDLYREYFKGRGMLTLQQRGQPACRRGTVREVERFRDALKALMERASQTSLPSEVRRKMP
jgi:hypothetical protein